MHAHEPYKAMLTGASGLYFAESLVILEQACRSQERGRTPNRIDVHSFQEFPCVFSEERSDERERSKSPQMDALLNIAMSRGAIYYRDSILVGIEIKTNYDDLRCDKKFRKYLGHSDFMYMAVTTELVEKALKKVADIDEYGVFDITSGRIWKRAKRQVISFENRYALKTIILDYSLNGNYTYAHSLTGEYLLGARAQKDDRIDDTLYCQVLYRRRRILDDAVLAVDYEDQLETLLSNARCGMVSYDDMVPDEPETYGWEYEYK